MDPLYSFHTNVIRQVNRSFFRFLYEEMNWDQRMLAIKGPRGSGKTTLMLQHMKYDLKMPANQALYVSADHYWFYNHNLYETAESFYLNGGRFLFIDEVHKYPLWSRELKNIYDGLPGLKIAFSASSALDIYRGEADLSRRVITYILPGMSFREYLLLRGAAEIKPLSFDEIVKYHEDLAKEISSRIRPLPHFHDYLKFGYLPIITESREDEIPLRLNQVINTVIESDLAYTEGFDSGTSVKMKKLLGVIAESVPFKPNVSALARKMDVSRESIYQWFTYLEKGGLIRTIRQKGKGVSTLQKPDKVYLENTNLAYAFKNNPDIGSIRESFLLNQLVNAGHVVTLPETGDFFTEEVTIEVGGKHKTDEQIKALSNPIIAADDIEVGYANKIPLWLFGFLC